MDGKTISLRVGASAVQLKADGSIAVTGKKINITAQGDDVTVNGEHIWLNPMGGGAALQPNAVPTPPPAEPPGSPLASLGALMGGNPADLLGKAGQLASIAQQVAGAAVEAAKLQAMRHRCSALSRPRSPPASECWRRTRRNAHGRARAADPRAAPEAIAQRHPLSTLPVRQDGQGRRFHDVVVVCASFVLAPGRLEPAAFHRGPVFADEPWDAAHATLSSLRMATDVLLLKPDADVYVTGTAHALDWTPRRDWRAELQVHRHHDAPLLHKALRLDRAAPLGLAAGRRAAQPVRRAAHARRAAALRASPTADGDSTRATTNRPRPAPTRPTPAAPDGSVAQPARIIPGRAMPPDSRSPARRSSTPMHRCSTPTTRTPSPSASGRSRASGSRVSRWREPTTTPGANATLDSPTWTTPTISTNASSSTPPPTRSWPVACGATNPFA